MTDTKPFLQVGDITVDAATSNNTRHASLFVRGSEFIKKFTVHLQGNGPHPTLLMTAHITYPKEYDRTSSHEQFGGKNLEHAFRDVGYFVKKEIQKFIEDFDPTTHPFDLAHAINNATDSLPEDDNSSYGLTGIAKLRQRKQEILERKAAQ